jgi:inorganic pyrophosphatase
MTVCGERESPTKNPKDTPVNESPLRGLQDMAPRELVDIERFFKTYNEAHGRQCKITGRGDRRAAEAALERAIRTYRREHTAGPHESRRG